MSEEKSSNVESKLDTIIEKIHEMNVTLAENTQSLVIHEKRTDIAERKIEILNNRIDELKEKESVQFKELSDSIQDKFNAIEDQVLPIKIHVEAMDKVFSIVWKVLVPAVIGIFGILYKFGFIKLP